MEHFLTQRLHRYWQSLCDGNRPPMRRQLEPHLIKAILPHAFILQRIDDRHLIFRLAGTRICELYGREFRDHNFLQMWEDPARRSVRLLVNELMTTGAPGLINYNAETFDKHEISSEIILLPMRDDAGQTSRLLGSAIQLDSAKELKGKMIVRQSVSSVHKLNARAELFTPIAAAHALHGTTPPYLKLVHSR